MRMFLATILVLAISQSSIADDEIAATLAAARANYAVQLEDAQKKLLETVDAEIAKGAKSGSLETVKALQQEKTA
ncbi:MAG TPA: hypothetical protein VL096_21560, partial [Pirellulaceae bacterium]|nr:hypothetical protein [Pirellulaceae bacterium]